MSLHLLAGEPKSNVSVVKGSKFELIFALKVTVSSVESTVVTDIIVSF